MSNSTLSQAAIDAFAAEAKIGLLATLDPEGLPHISLITSLMAKCHNKLIWGQFFEGFSKDNIRRDPRAGFLVMSLDRDVWRGCARWTSETGEGDDYILLNNLSLFRYNSYINVHKVHYMDVVSASRRERLDVPGMVVGTLPMAIGRIGRSLISGSVSSEAGPLNPWTVGHLQKLETLKFLSYVDRSGYPVLVSGLPVSARDASYIDIAPTASQREIQTIADGSIVALFAINLQMESVLIRGKLTGIGAGNRGMCTLTVDWVYNSMPPFPGQIYPPIPLIPYRG